jgi:hypothetical protein
MSVQGIHTRFYPLPALPKTFGMIIMALLMLFAVSVPAQVTAHKKSKIDKAVVTRTYTVAQMHEELDIIEKKLRKFHPDPFHYISRDSLHLFVQSIKQQITAPLPDIKFRFYARQIVTKVGCGHTSLIPSKEYMKAVDSVNRQVFPVDVWLTDTNRLFVKYYLQKDSLLHTGDEILRINNKEVAEILRRIYTSFPSDGFNETYKKQSLQADRFRYFYASAYNFDTTYTVDIKTLKGELKTCTIHSISSFADTLKPKSNKRYTILYKNTKAQFKIDEKDPHLAVLDINNFGGKKWRKLMRLSFRYLRKHPEVNNLAIDLRDNGGGSVSKGNYLLTYLINKPFSLQFGRRVNLWPFQPGIKINPGARLTRGSFFIYPLSFVKDHKWVHWFPKFKKRKNHFNGQVYVLTNGRSFSMSVVTATFLKEKANATIVGEESGGTQSGSNAMLSGTVVLPYSKAQLIIPLYHIDHNLSRADTKRGLMPDYAIRYTISDLMQGKDLEMEKIRGLMQQDSTAAKAVCPRKN